MLGKMVFDYLFDDEVMDELVDGINKEVDIPLLSENSEEKAIRALINLLKLVMGKRLGV
jgi:hypothetical protein